MNVERVQHVRLAPGDDLPPRGHRWTYSASPESVCLGFAVKTGTDVTVELRRMLNAFKYLRERDAARILNKATTYDCTIGGDGVSLCSEHHPHDHVPWSNLIRSTQPLNADAMKAVQDHMSVNAYDEAGLRILLRTAKLIVHPDLKEDAEGLGVPFVAWDHLTNPKAWFIKTTAYGLSWYERSPLSIAARLTSEKEIMVIGHEKRCFTYSNPRAVFGVIPAAA
jgi:hypothetical protein